MSSNVTSIAKPATASGGGIITAMAHRYGLEANRFLATIQATVFPQGKPVTLEQTAAFLVVANQYNLNPFIKEIYAFPGRSGGIVPIVSVDGWATLINRQEQLDGIQFEDRIDDQNALVAVTCRIYRKDRSRPTEVTEYMDECKRDTDTWRKWPARMLRHKALIQCARYAFGLVGIYDPDEAERIADADAPTGSTEPQIQMPQRASHTQTQPIVEGEVVAEGEQQAPNAEPSIEQEFAFNPMAQTDKDFISAKQAKSIIELCGNLKIDPDETASSVFKTPLLKVDDLSKEAADRLIADLKARSEG
jgi:phage recombination protein Bet